MVYGLFVEQQTEGIPGGSGIRLEFVDRRGIQPGLARVELVVGKEGDWQVVEEWIVGVQQNEVLVVLASDFTPPPGKQIGWRVWDAFQLLDLNPAPAPTTPPRQFQLERSCWPDDQPQCTSSSCHNYIDYRVTGVGERIVSAVTSP
jgi:hypothetical protein